MMTKNDIDFRVRNLLFVDLETTGLNPDVHEIIEVGCLLVNGKNLKVISEYSAKIKPKHINTATPKAIEVSGYIPLLWENAKSEEEVLGDLVRLAPNAIVVGWKVDFDWWFLEHAFERHRISYDFDYHLIDVIPLAYAYFRKREGINGLGLRKVAAYFKIKMEEQHDALGDIKGTYRVFKKLMSIYDKKN